MSSSAGRRTREVETKTGLFVIVREPHEWIACEIDDAVDTVEWA